MKILLLGLLLVNTSLAYPNDKVRCATDSNGFEFSAISRALKVAQENAVSKCTSHSRTNNSECKVNLLCDGDEIPDRMKCITASNGFEFSDDSYDLKTSQDNAVMRCTSHSDTTNPECTSNLMCFNESENHISNICITGSNGFEFDYTSISLKAAKVNAVSRCTSHSGTTKPECISNLTCFNKKK